MQQKPALDLLLATLDASLQQLEFCRSESLSEIVRPILLRRRRARVGLRALLRWAGHPAPEAVTVPGLDPSRHSLYGLWRAEQQLISIYDTALAQAAPNTLEKALLAAQRAEAEDAYLTITAAIQKRDVQAVPHLPFGNTI